MKGRGYQSGWCRMPRSTMGCGLTKRRLRRRSCLRGGLWFEPGSVHEAASRAPSFGQPTWATRLGANGCEWRDPVIYPTGAQGVLWPRAIVLFRCP